MQNNTTAKTAGNRCGHNPKNPRLQPLTAITKGKGGLPRILSFAAEKTKDWYYNPKNCPELQSKSHRKIRSERREAIIIIIETLLKRLDLASLQIGTPTKQGFINIDMRTIVRESGLSQRRCERAILQLKNAGFITITQPRVKHASGQYVALRAIRIITKAFFDWLGLSNMLKKERARALIRQTTKFGHAISTSTKRIMPPKPHLKERIAWNKALSKLVLQGMDITSAQKQVNSKYGFPLNWSPGQPWPVK